MDFENHLSFAIATARQAGGVLRGYFQTGLSAQHKGVIDLVTQADMDAEALILERLRQTFPNHHVLTEERGENHVVSDFTWLIDPLDGTTNFAHGYPQFSVSIALQHKSNTVLGVVYDVMRDELYAALQGKPATLNEYKIRVSDTPDLAHSLLVTGFPYDRQTDPDNNLDRFSVFLLRSQGVRRLGSAALDLCAVAAGRLDGYWESKLNPWDIAAGALIVTEAGGQVSDWDGQVFRPETGRVVASNGHIHAEMLSVLAESVERASLSA